MNSSLINNHLDERQDDILKSIQEDMRKDLSAKWLLLLFFANRSQPIRGKILLTKLVFLLSKEINQELEKDLEFFPYQYGPYSTELAKRINRMLDIQWLKSMKTGSQWEFSITEKGEELAKEIISELCVENKTMDKITEMKKTSSNKGLKRLLSEIYRAYPEFTLYSRMGS